MELGRFPVTKAFSNFLTWGGVFMLLVAALMFCGALLPTRQNFPVNPDRDPNPIYQAISGLGNLIGALSLGGSGLGLLLTGEALRLGLAIEERLFQLNEDTQETQRLLRQMNPEAASKQATSAMLLLREELQQARFSMERTANATETLASTVQRRSGG